MDRTRGWRSRGGPSTPSRGNRGGYQPHGGGRGGYSGGGGAGGEGQSTDRKPREAILDLGKYLDRAITVKFSGGREGSFSLFKVNIVSVVPWKGG